MLKYISAIVVLLVFLSATAKLGFAERSATEDGNLYVVTTTAHLADVVENLNPGHIHVESLMGTGVDPHLYRPTSSDVIRLKKADLIFYSGLHLEGQMVNLLETLEKEKPAVAVGDHLDKNRLLAGPNNATDPHIWMSVPLWKNVVDIMAQTLSEQDPSHAFEYKEKARTYNTKLEKLNSYIKASIKTISPETRTLITAHDAFSYFGETYGVEVIGIQGLSTESEAGLKHIETLVNRLTHEKIPAVFTETSVTDRNIKALISGAQNKGHTVAIGGALYSDALGKAGTYEGTYIGMMEHNVKTLTKALGGSPPPFLIQNKFSSRTP